MTAEQTTVKEGKPDDDLALSRIKEEIEARAQRKAEKKVNEAKEKAKEIIQDAKDEAQQLKKKIINEAENDAAKAKTREISRKKLSVKMDYLETRESIIDEIQVEAKSQLQKFTKSKEYPEFLETLVKSTALSIGGGDLVLHLRTEDKSHLTKDSLAKIGKEVSKETDEDTTITVGNDNLNALGGIKMVRSDNKLFVDNTFETRLDRKSDDIREALLDLLR